MTQSSAPAKPPVNPWMIALTVLWSALLALALLLLMVGAGAASMTYDQPGMPTSLELAAIYFACSGVTAGVAVVVIAVQLGVGALRWHLDPSTRHVEPPREASAGPRVRNDF